MGKEFKFIIYRDNNNLRTLKTHFGYVNFHKDLLPHKPHNTYMWNDPECMGGGKFTIDYKKKEIQLYGESLDFGKADKTFLKVLIVRDRDTIKNDVWYATQSFMMENGDVPELVDENFEDYKIVIDY